MLINAQLAALDSHQLEIRCNVRQPYHPTMDHEQSLSKLFGSASTDLEHPLC
jgi:hypothetical protein